MTFWFSIDFESFSGFLVDFELVDGGYTKNHWGKEDRNYKNICFKPKKISPFFSNGPLPSIATRDAQNRVKNRFRVGSKPVPVLVTSSKTGSRETRVGSYPVLTVKIKPRGTRFGYIKNQFSKNRFWNRF